MLKITNFDLIHIEQAKKLAHNNYIEEKQYVQSLPMIERTPDLTEFAENNLGVVAIENDELVGFLCCYNSWDNDFNTNAKGTFSPIHAHGAISSNREMIYKRLYQSAAEKWVQNNITVHAIGLYAHDVQAINSFYNYGFGLRCVDAVRFMEKIDVAPCEGYEFSELEKANVADITPLRRMLSAHLGLSPCFMVGTPQETDAWIKRAIARNSQVFIARKNGEIVAFIEITNGGENFVSETSDMKNICGAFCLPEYRGQNIIPNLLNFAISIFKSQGFTRLGVDFESFNPTAYGFWLKHFTAYTNSVVRRI